MDPDRSSLLHDSSLPKLVRDQLADKQEIRPFRAYPPSPESYEKAIEEREKKGIDRKLLVRQLHRQYEKDGVATNPSAQKNIEGLKEPGSFTVTTGHQLQVLTGPLLYIHKTLQTIRLAEELQKQYPEQRIVPVHWMASEDHDLAEVDHITVQGKSYQWKTEQEGAVGRMDPKGIDAMIGEVKETVKKLPHAEEWSSRMEKAYREGDTIASATRTLLNELFGDRGLVVIDGDDRELKKAFIPDMKAEVEEERGRTKVEERDAELEQAGYHLQVHPRRINLFYLEEGTRPRIEKKEERFLTVDASHEWSKKELLAAIDEHPERFSPNVILRPLYQERILPNLAYVGGPAEIAYWHQLKGLFDEAGAFFPVLQLRSRIFHGGKKEAELLEKVGLSPQDLLQPRDELVREKIRRESEHDLELEREEAEMKRFYQELAKKASLIDPNLHRSSMAEARKAEKGLERMKKKMIRHTKKHEKTLTDRIDRLYSHFFPGGSPHERVENFAPYYSQEGRTFLDRTASAINPMKAENIWIVDKEG